MNFVLVRGKDFLEHFDFKNDQGSPIALPAGVFRVVLERGGFAREYTVANGGLTQHSTRVEWRIPASDSSSFDFNTMYYTLYLDSQELARGVVKVQ